MSWDLNTGDYLGDIPRVYKGKLKNILLTSNNTLYIAKSAISLIEHAKEVLKDPNTNPKVKSRLNTLINQIDLEDNPILIVGKLRK